MKMKRLLAWLMILVICFTLVACRRVTSDNSSVNSLDKTSSTTETKAEGSTPLLYRVTDNNGRVVWLFGSIHIGREDYYPLPDYVLEAFDDADSLAVELDINAFEKDKKLQTQALSQMVYTDGSRIDDHIPEELYNKAVSVMEELDIYMSIFDRYCPAFWSSMIESVQYEKMGLHINLGIDHHLLDRAYENQKEILEVESAELQYQMMAGFSDELQALLLEETVDMYENPETTKSELDELMDIWAAGDEKEFSQYLAGEDQDMTAEEKQLYEEYIKAMFVDRNLLMADYAETSLKSGKEVFICVGAVHIVGEGAVAELLKQRGYKVECITG